MNLEDTIGLMCSDNFRDRMKAEYIQLRIRMKKIDKRIEEAYGSSAEGQMLRQQRNAMKYYRDALRYRMEDQKINFHSIDELLEED